SFINKKFTALILFGKQTLCLFLSNKSFIFVVMKSLQTAIDYFGSQAALARAIGVNSMAITQWKRRGVPPKRARQIAEKTNNYVRTIDLRPDIFGELPPGPDG